ncbi:uncharacterized protein MELLADRAFT_93547 [Melampsora larici-populina 98AG31]|uniref:Rab-GAP TBC domain-containing protein n=1 Tax=Melampsora larici-populina (strain 98AG31 / pathotype 3-4-7) TaxID=747676 RepID=F4RAT5_MELLP|nr:uncharacterized protein MELLADRAFT_93547 [Melampsora larici-populina 98AG31]EGG10532.1 hypothetical protein MELLADRAFT_93547 [Melampsora larici-populina 98AG31]
MSNHAYDNEDQKPLEMTIKPTWPPVFPLCANDRQAWTLQAKAGGLGTGTAKSDHSMTEDTQELMYLKGDRITILIPMLNACSNSNSDPNPEKFTFLGFCEGQIGFVSIQNLRFQSPIRNNPAYLQELFNNLEQPAINPNKPITEKSYSDHLRELDFESVEGQNPGTNSSFKDVSKRNSVHIKSSNPNRMSRRRQLSSASSCSTGVTGVTDLSSQDSSILPPPLPPPPSLPLPKRKSSISTSPPFLKQIPSAYPNTETNNNSSRMRKISMNSTGKSEDLNHSSPRHSIINQSSNRELSTKSSFTLPKRNKAEKAKQKRNPSRSKSVQISAPTLTCHTNPMIESSTGIAATPHRELIAKPSHLSLSAKDNGIQDNLTEELTLLASNCNQSTSPLSTVVTTSIPLRPDDIVTSNLTSPARSHSFQSSASSERQKKSSKEPRVLDYGPEEIITIKGGSAFELVKPHTINRRKSKTNLLDQDEMILAKFEVEVEKFADEFEQDMERAVEVSYPSMNQKDVTILNHEDNHDLDPHPDESILEDGESYRIKEQKWVQVLNSTSNKKDNKKIKKLIKNGLPKSLRGRIWGYLLNLNSQLKVQGLFEKVTGLIDDELDDEVLIDSDLEKICRQFDFHHFSQHDSTGISDLKTLIKTTRTYSKLYLPFDGSLDFDLSLVGGLLLIQSPLEEAFWNLLGIATIGFPNLWNQSGFLLVCDRFTKILEEIDVVLFNHLLFVWLGCFL